MTIYRCQWCDAEYEEDIRECPQIVLNWTMTAQGLKQVESLCEGKVKEVLPCPDCGLTEFPCKCDREKES